MFMHMVLCKNTVNKETESYSATDVFWFLCFASCHIKVVSEVPILIQRTLGSGAVSFPSQTPTQVAFIHTQ